MIPTSDRHQYGQTKKSNFKISSDSSNYGGHTSGRRDRGDSKSKPSTRSRKTDKKEMFTNMIKMNSHRSYNKKRPPPLFDPEYSDVRNKNVSGKRSVSPVKPKLFKEDYNDYYADDINELEMIHERAQMAGMKNFASSSSDRPHIINTSDKDMLFEGESELEGQNYDEHHFDAEGSEIENYEIEHPHHNQISRK